MTDALYGLLGGAIIGLAASLLLLSVGRIAGISGIVGGLVNRASEGKHWRLAFLLGLLAGGAVVTLAAPQALRGPSARSIEAVLIAGFLVGVGTQLGKGCTSGHGVCGLSRLSRRSMVGTMSFMFAGVVTATLHHLLAGGS